MADVAVVTGAAQGIGAATAETLLGEGWRVHMVDVDETRLAEAWSADRTNVATHAVDLGDPGAIDQLWQTLDKSGEQVDALVNNAGIFFREPALDVTVADWDRVLAVNLRGTFLMSQAFARRVVARRGKGAIVSISSGQAFKPSSTGAAYAASKAGISNLTRALAGEWGPYGIRVNTVVPGLTDTAQPRAHKDDADFAAAAASNPLRRLATPSDVADAVSFLLSAKASAITGQAIVVNGGRLMI
jgi:NAD(P)-dependent dehydrogenase (short-subunit alcohol dehydrogenase family)